MYFWRNSFNKLQLERQALTNLEFQTRRRYLLTCAWRYRQLSRGNTLGMGW